MESPLIKFKCQQCKFFTFIRSDADESDRYCDSCLSPDLEQVPVGDPNPQPHGKQRDKSRKIVFDSRNCLRCEKEYKPTGASQRFCTKDCTKKNKEQLDIPPSEEVEQVGVEKNRMTAVAGVKIKGDTLVRTVYDGKKKLLVVPADWDITYL